MAPLPNYRVRPHEPVFSSISIDYAGPYEVKRGTSTEKRWACIFVCNVTSAVRIEVVESLQTIAFLNALRRFLCLSGNKTGHMRSDCATTFVGAKNVLDRELTQAMSKFGESPEGRRFLQDAVITWEFSAPVSSHHQGTVERQV